MKKWTERFASSDLLLFENDELIIVNKPPGISSQKDPTTGLSILEWMQSIRPGTLHLHSRLDKPVSGILILCKSTGTIPSTVKKYLALVPQKIPDTGRLDNFIRRDGRRHKAIISDHPGPDYKDCHLSYKVIRRLDRYALIEIIPETGRFHQIRAQLVKMGWPIRGDVKYGARRRNRDRSIDLHAHFLNIGSGVSDIFALPLGRENIWNEIWTEELLNELMN